MKTKILEFLKSNQAKTFYWNTTYNTLVFAGGLLAFIKPDVLDPKLSLLLGVTAAGLSALSKAINKKFL